jgi:microcystin-dependent protein
LVHRHGGHLPVAQLSTAGWHAIGEDFRMTNAFLGQISMFAGNFAPKLTAFCNGQILPIAQNQALFSLLGTTYGGNGQTTFGLPNLQSQLSVHQGQGQGLSSYSLGQAGGVPTVTIDQNTTPTHIHTLNATGATATTATIGNTVLPGRPTASIPPAQPAFYAFQGAPPLPTLIPHPMNPAAVGNTGGGQPHTNLMPSLCISFIIYLQGIFPSRN